MFTQINDNDLNATNGGFILGRIQDRNHQEGIDRQVEAYQAAKSNSLNTAGIEVSARSDELTRRNEEWRTWMENNPKEAQAFIAVILG